MPDLAEYTFSAVVVLGLGVVRRLLDIRARKIVLHICWTTGHILILTVLPV